MTRIGRTCRLESRVKSLTTSLWVTDSRVYVIRCHSGPESLKLERHLTRKYAAQHVAHDWYHQVSPEDIARSLTYLDGWGHLLLVPLSTPSSIIEPVTKKAVTTSSRFSILLN